jgi:hypothetical protein
MGDNFAHFVASKGRHVFLGQFLKQKLIPQTAGGISRALFLAAKNRKIHPCLLQQFGKRTRHTLRSAVIRTCTTHPVEHVEVRMVFRQWNIQPFRPIRTVSGRQSPRISTRLHPAQGRCRSATQFAFPHTVPAHVCQQGQRIHSHRADPHAGAAGRAGPQGVRGDHSLMQARNGACTIPAGGDRTRAGGHRPLQSLNKRFGREWLARRKSRTGLLASPTLHARIQTQQLLPIEMGYGCDPDTLGPLHILDRHRNHLPKRRLREQQIQWTHDGMNQARKRKRSDEPKNQ